MCSARMTDRLQEIRARLDVAQHYKPGNVGTLDAQLRARFEEDIAWLLDEVERLRPYTHHQRARCWLGGKCACGLEVLP